MRPGAVALLAVIGCGGPTADSGPRAAVRDSAGIVIVENHAPSAVSWRLPDVPLLTIGPDLSVEQSPLDPTAVFVGADSRIIVGDGNQVGWDAILVYEGDGRFVTKLGGKGRGPGEFGGQLWWAGPYRGDSIVAWDRRGPTGPSMKIFGPDGGYSRDVPIRDLRLAPPPGTYSFSPGFHGAFSDGYLLTSSDGVLEIPSEPGPAWYQHYLLATPPAGESLDTIGRYGLAQAYWDGQKQTTRLYGPSTTVLPYGDDLLLGRSDAYEYSVITRAGTTKRIVRKAYTPQPVQPADVEAVVTRFVEAGRANGATEERLRQTRSNVEGYPRAAEKPAYSSMIVDPGLRVWVERYRWFDPWSVPPEPQPSTWDVFSPEGEWLAEVVVPARIVLLAASRDRLLGVHVDSLDVKQIVGYAMPAFGDEPRS
jgi:hypothetical protein